MDLQGNRDGFQQSLVSRVKNILLQPQTEWDVIDKEPATIAGLYRNYIFILAAIGPVCGFVHGVLFGYSFMGVTYRPSVMAALGTAITGYVLALVGVFVLAMVIDGLAPTFNATKDRVQAFKVATYMGTASWVAGIFQLIPGLGFLGILGLYSLYLLYLGLPKLMKAPADKAMSYTVVTVIAAIALFLLAGAIMGPLTRMFVGGINPVSDPGSVSGSMTIPGVGKVDLGKMEQAAKQMEQSAKSGETNAIAPASLQALLPASVAGMARTETSSASAGAAGIGGSEADARYVNGDANISLQITDIAAAGALAAFGSALNVQSSKQSSTGYEKVGTVDGRMTTEKWENGSNSGSYGVLVANRFMVQADGSGTSMDALKSAVAAVGIDRLEAMAKQ
jgi:hypothetical protein